MRVRWTAGWRERSQKRLKMPFELLPKPAFTSMRRYLKGTLPQGTTGWMVGSYVTSYLSSHLKALHNFITSWFVTEFFDLTV